MGLAREEEVMSAGSLGEDLPAVNVLNGTLPDTGSFSVPKLLLWLPRQGSNLGRRIQSPLCYHYTTGQSAGRTNASGEKTGVACL